MKLFVLPGAASLASHIALEFACGADAGRGAAPFEVVVMPRGTNHAPAYLAVNPGGTVPALVMQNGPVLLESLAILLHIADRFPESALAPPAGHPQRDRLHMLLSMILTTVQPAFHMFRRSERYADFAEGQEAVRRAAQEKIKTSLGRLQDEIQPNGLMVGDRISVADLMLFVIGRWGMSIPWPTMRYPRLWSATQYLAAQPATQRAMATEGIGMDVPADGLG
jgi:glutathione S-transferase